jgi:UDP-N-acetylglucosamine--N-acetylmuramyl-(pentapeptide) pyrophosphoryl-undecaprenol N-acetylglucosamine transferase
MAERILIAAGGTGGHLFPGISVADVLRSRAGFEVVFVGTSRGLETRLVPQAGYALELLPILPLNGVGPLRTVLGLLALPNGLLRALLLLRRERPRAVLGVGGYAGGPLVLVSALAGVRTVILEPNARPGFTNRVLAPFVTRAACAFPETLASLRGKGVVTGNPVRRAFFDRGAGPQGTTLLAFGGSQGSRALNDGLLRALPEIPDGVRIVHQTGPAAEAGVRAAYARAGREAEVHAFLDDMPARFREASLVVCRSGATTCAELAAAGKAAVLVPFALSANDHQTENARALEGAGAGVLVRESEIERLGSVLRELLSSAERRRAMGEAASSLARPGAAEAVADLVEGRA